MTAECVASACSHHRFTCQTAQQTSFIAPVICEARGAPSFPFSLTSVRGAERRKALRSSSGTLERCRAPETSGTRASRRSTAAIFNTATALLRRTEGTSHSRYPGGIGAALHPMLSKPLKAAPSSGADGDRASWDEVTSLACRRRTLLRQLDVPRRRPR